MRRLFSLGAVLGALAAATAGATAAAPPAADIPQWRAVLLAAPNENSPPRIRISHRGPVIVDTSLPRAAAGYEPSAVRFDGSAAAGHTLVWADVVIPGRDTQTLSVLYDFAPGSRTPRVTTRSWGILGYDRRRDNGQIVFVTEDPAYTYERANVRDPLIVPILVQAYRSGSFVDVTSAHPQLIAAELANYRSGFQPGVCESDEVMAAYLADMVRLGRTQQGVADVTARLSPRSDAQFFTRMNAILHAKKLLPTTQRLGIAPAIPRCDPTKQRP